MTTGVLLDVMALSELARRHPSELEQLRDALEAANGRESGSSDSTDDHEPWLPVDRFGRTLSLSSLVMTAAGEVGRIQRFDQTSERALVELEDGRTRMLRLRRIELRRGRPRKASYAV